MTLKMITVKEIKALREETGLSVMQCQKALEEAGGGRNKTQKPPPKKTGEKYT